MRDLETPPRPTPTARERELLKDERTRSDVDFRPGVPASSSSEPTRTFPIVLVPPGGAETYHGPAVGPADQQTAPFLAVLAAGDQATRVPPGGAGPAEHTAGFMGVLPVPGHRPGGKGIEAGLDLGGFHLVRRIVAGPTCELFAATHLQHGPCVVQVLTEGMAQSPAGRGFLLDSRARTTLEDPRLARILGLGDSPRPWVALERLEGATLRQVLEAQGGLGPERAGRLVLDLARGLSRLHARRIAHGDLRAEDVRLEADRAVITGFGTWKTIEGGARRPFPGGPSTGAALHAAPEQFKGERATPATDVWALGLLLVEATTGRPWVQGEPGEVMTTLVEGELPPIPPDLPHRLGNVARRCLERSPARRYPSAQEVAQALHAVLPEEATPSRRPRLLPAAIVAAVMVGVVAVVIALALSARG